MTATNNSSARAALEFRGVTRTHGEGARAVTALNSVSFTVPAGQFVAIMGPSGSGKSTLLNLAGALDTPTSGTILLGETDLSAVTRADSAKLRRTRIGYVFQSYNLVPTLSALENVSLPLELDGVARPAAEAAAHEALAKLDIDHLASRFPIDLSGGEAQRVAIARAIVGSREILLADEPTGALDSHTSESVIALLRERADAGTTVLLVTHDARLAAWADRVIYLRDGEIVDDSGTAESEA